MEVMVRIDPELPDFYTGDSDSELKSPETTTSKANCPNSMESKYRGDGAVGELVDVVVQLNVMNKGRVAE